MIPNATMDVETLESNFSGERIDMTLDEESLSHIMSVLTDLYSDTILASVREYSTNARDAHLDAGKAQVPIEVTAPSGFNPMFKVRDYGKGLTLDDLRKVYSKYGASTKRDNVQANGMIGVGSKAALTYTSSFTVVSVANKTKYIVSVSRDEDGGGHFDIVDISETSEPSGVEVQIPVARQDVSTFRLRIEEFFKWWEGGSVKVDDVINEGYDLEGLNAIDDDDKIYFGTRHDSLIVMGGVAYPSPYDAPFSYGKGFVYFADMGEVVFSPSRESLRTNKKNRMVYEKIIGDIKAKVSQKAVDQVSGAANIVEAYRRADEANRTMIYPVLGGGHTPTYVYKGQPLAGTLEAVITAWFAKSDDNFIYRSNIVSSGRPTSARRFDSRYHGGTVAAHVTESEVMVSGVPEEVIYDNRRRTVFMRGMRELGHTGKYALVFNDLDGFDKAIDNAIPVVAWTDVQNASREVLKRNRTAGVKRKEAKKNVPEAHVIDSVSGEGTMHTTIRNIDPTGKDVVFAARGDVRTSSGVISGYDTYSRARTFEKIMGHFEDHTFVAVSKGQEESFKKRFPKAVSLVDMINSMSGKMLIDEVAKRHGGTFDKAEIHQFVGGYYNFDYSGVIDILTRVCDDSATDSDHVREFVEKQRAAKQVLRAYEQVTNEWKYFTDSDKTDKYLSDNFEVDKVEKVHARTTAICLRYPILGEISRHNLHSSRMVKHVGIYIDAVDASGDQ